MAIAAAHPRSAHLVVEIDQKAQTLLDPQLTRRLIQLELGDVEVPPPAAATTAGHPPPPSLYFRVMVTPRGTVRVELWERGEFGGARSVSASHGSSQIRSRRIALAAAELARRLRQKRLYERQQHLDAKKRAEKERRAAAAARAPRVALLAGAVGATLGPGDAWLGGPELTGQLRIRGARLGVGAAWLLGTVPLAEGTPSARWLELSLSPSYAVPLGHSLDLDVGLTAAAAAVHLTGATQLDGIANEHDTWSARAAGHFYLESRLSSTVALGFGPEVGAVLRSVPLTDAHGAEHRLGGLWLGAELGVVLDPAAPAPASP